MRANSQALGNLKGMVYQVFMYFLMIFQVKICPLPTYNISAFRTVLFQKIIKMAGLVRIGR
ncbi:hypothetical protein DCMF_04800 [Candidatus Formimonas warabiya]|uniref:Uncharacterized protein n=1 Tax=Formimonas warabiya TaxID=1761012 RepID=A0A3G1KP38_FORW1|nr:hypothetical protein DCMF_04800 [Candidatus Formimonas warabiya]